MADLPINYVDGQIVHGPEINSWMAAINAGSKYLGTAASQAAMLALIGKPGDFCLRTDVPDLFYLVGSPPTSLASWQATDAGAEKTANKNQPNGYAGLDSGGKVAAAQLPSYVDDVLEYANLAGFPSSGQQTGVIYVADDTGKAYRWSGSAYIEISPSPGSTDSVSEGSVNLYFTNARADARVAAAVTDHADGTVSVNGVAALEPLSTVTIVTTNIAPIIGQTTYYNAKIPAANLTPPMLALSGQRVGARFAARRDPVDDSSFTVTLTCQGSDTFYSSGATTATLPMSGEQREYEVISVSGTKYYAPAGSLNPVSALDKRYLHQWPFPMARNTIAAVGDSLTYGGSYGGYLPGVGHSWLGQLQVMTHQRIHFGAGNFAVSGTTIAYSQATELPQVLAMNPLPGACVLAVANGDVRAQAAPNANFPTTVATLKAMVASLLAVGVVPILWTIPPETGVSSPISEDQYQANILQWNTYIRRYASLNGFPIVDAHTALAAIDGTFLPGLLSVDGVHPNGAGYRTIAQQALADGLADIFPPNSLIHTARQTNDLSTLFNDGTKNLGLFTTDSNSDGIADGLTATGTATFSLVAPVPSDQLQGNWQQVAVTAGNQATLSASITTGWSVGDVIAFSARVQTQGIESSGATWIAAALTDTPGGYVTPNGTNVTALYNGLVSWQSDRPDGEVYVEFPVLTQMTDMKLFIWIQTVPAGTATVRVGEATIRNLTTEGLLI